MTLFARRLDIFRAEVLLHRAGISHGDVASRNFVKSLPLIPSSPPLPDTTSRVRLIDFDRAKQHICPSFSSPPSASSLSPSPPSPSSPLFIPPLSLTLDELLNSRSPLRAQIRTCDELERMRIRFGLSHEKDIDKEMNAAQRRKFVPWDGGEWGSTRTDARVPGRARGAEAEDDGE